MGNLVSQELVGAITDLGIDLETSIAIHLTTNHFPPVPKTMVKPCIEAIEAVNEGEPDRLIALPEGVFWRLGTTSAPALAIVEGHHLEAWLSDGNEF